MRYLGDPLCVTLVILCALPLVILCALPLVILCALPLVILCALPLVILCALQVILCEGAIPPILCLTSPLILLLLPLQPLTNYAYHTIPCSSLSFGLIVSLLR